MSSFLETRCRYIGAITRFSRQDLKNTFTESIALLRGTHNLAVLFVLSRLLRSVRWFHKYRHYNSENEFLVRTIYPRPKVWGFFTGINIQKIIYENTSWH